MLIILNWKTNVSRTAGIELAENFVRYVGSHRLKQTSSLRSGLQRQPREEQHVTFAIAPPHLMLRDIGDAVAGSLVKLAAQDCSVFDGAAHTGETTARMLWEYGCQYVIVGHSERRRDQRESSEVVAAKVGIVQAASMIPVVCVGESQAEEDSKQACRQIEGQLEASLPEFSLDMPARSLVVAYEPVWSVGTDKVPTTDHIQAVCAAIRKTIGRMSVVKNENIQILYGGSVTSSNCRGILQVPGIGGLLIGRASLVYEDLVRIAAVALDLAKAPIT